MKISSQVKICDDFDKLVFYRDLLLEEDFSFKNKDIKVEILNINKENSEMDINVLTNSVLDTKIGVNALLKSLEIINKVDNI